MIEILFNDIISTLSFVHIPNQETLAIVDEDLKVYKTITYGTFEPSDDDLANAWDKALHDYYELDCEEVTSEWRIDQSQKSLEAFKEYLKEERKNRGNEYDMAYDAWLCICACVNGQDFEESKDIIKDWYDIDVMEREDDHNLYDVNFETCCFTIKNVNGKASVDENSIEIYQDDSPISDCLGSFTIKEIADRCELDEHKS